MDLIVTFNHVFEDEIRNHYLILLGLHSLVGWNSEFSQTLLHFIAR